MGLEVMVGSICCRLDTLVYIMGLVLTVLYLLSGVAAIVWFVLTHTQVGTHLLCHRCTWTCVRKRVISAPQVTLLPMPYTVIRTPGAAAASQAGPLRCRLVYVGLATDTVQEAPPESSVVGFFVHASKGECS